MAYEAWKKLEESFEGTKAIKGAKAYILKEKFASFKMKEDESVPDMLHRMEVLVNDLKALGEKWRTRTSLISSWDAYLQDLAHWSLF